MIFFNWIWCKWKAWWTEAMYGHFFNSDRSIHFTAARSSKSGKTITPKTNENRQINLKQRAHGDSSRCTLWAVWGRQRTRNAFFKRLIRHDTWWHVTCDMWIWNVGPLFAITHKNKGLFIHGKTFLEIDKRNLLMLRHLTMTRTNLLQTISRKQLQTYVEDEWVLSIAIGDGALQRTQKDRWYRESRLEALAMSAIKQGKGQSNCRKFLCEWCIWHYGALYCWGRVSIYCRRAQKDYEKCSS